LLPKTPKPLKILNNIFRVFILINLVKLKPVPYLKLIKSLFENLKS